MRVTGEIFRKLECAYRFSRVTDHRNRVAQCRFPNRAPRIGLGLWGGSKRHHSLQGASTLGSGLELWNRSNRLKSRGIQARLPRLILPCGTGAKKGGTKACTWL